MEHSLYIHKKSGGVYKVLGDEVINTTNDRDGQEMVFYVSLESGMTFVRERHEFFDGRFEPYTSEHMNKE